jgi:TRAP-type mannitol/chloroaromatic compound transport system substrate-binding protein
MEASYNAAMELHGEIAKENPSFKTVNDSMLDFTKNGYQWFQVAEYSYDTFMIRKSRG